MKLDLFALFTSNKKQPLALPMADAESHQPVTAPDLYDGAKVFGGLAWYQEQYAKAMKLCVMLGGGLCLSLIVIGALIYTRPSPRFFAATPDLRLAPLVPLDKPVLTQQGLLNWISETVSNAVSLDFLEWREKLTRAREHFDDEAFKSFLASLKSSGMLEMVQEKRLSVSAVVTRAPVIIASGQVDGKATWKVEFPIVLSYESSQGVESTQKLMATVLVRRAATVTTPRGVVIQQVVLKRDS